MESFEIEVTEYQEQEDGSAIVTLEMCDKAKSLMIEAGFISLVKKHIDEVLEDK